MQLPELTTAQQLDVTIDVLERTIIAAAQHRDWATAREYEAAQITWKLMRRIKEWGDAGKRVPRAGGQDHVEPDTVHAGD